MDEKMREKLIENEKSKKKINKTIEKEAENGERELKKRVYK